MTTSEKKALALKSAGSAGWQDAKSRITRGEILEAGVQCLIVHGYAGTTVEKIAAAAKLSRGAMMHHYSSRLDVVRAVATHLSEVRLHEFEMLAKALSLKEATFTAEHAHLLVHNVYKYYEKPSYTAYYELKVSSRTDKDLLEIMKPIYKAFEKKHAEIIVRTFPEWKDQPVARVLLTDFLHLSIQGIVHALPMLPPKRVASLLRLIEQEMLLMYGRAPELNQMDVMR